METKNKKKINPEENKKENYNEKDIGKSFDSKLFLKLLSYAKPYILIFALCMIFLIMVTAVDLAKPYILKYAIDDIITLENREYIVTDDEQEALITIKGKMFAALPKEIGENTRTWHIYKLSDKYYVIPNQFKGKDFEILDNEVDAFLRTDSEQVEVYHLKDNNISDMRINDKSNLLSISIIYVFILIGGFLFNYLQVYLLNLTSQKIIYNMRQDLFTHLLRLSMNFFEKNPVGRLVTRVTNDLNNINEMYTVVLLNVIKDVIMLIGIVIIMLTINYKLALVCFVTLPAVIGVSVVFRIKIREIERDVKKKLAVINSKLSEYISGMKIIQIFNAEENYLQDFKEVNDDYLSSTLKQIKISGIFRPSMHLLYSIALSLLLFYGSRQVLNSTIEIGVLFAFTNYIHLFYRPIFDFAEKFNIMQSAMASGERLFLLYEEDNLIPESDSPKKLKKIKGNIEFKNVYFSYGKDENYVLKNVSFKINKGETIAIVGSTGSGKTTITNLISRFYDIDKGQILIDGVDITQIEISRLREHIGMVLQDVFLFSKDVKSNIRLLNDKISDKKVIASAEYVNADKYISMLPEDYDYIVKERGQEFSTGQRQLLSFARALAFNPEIMILDEATSNIDTETEELIQDAINKIVKDRTTIVIAHRLSTIKNADKILVLNKGEIVEQGNHDELLGKQGIYYNLYQIQFEDEEDQVIS